MIGRKGGRRTPLHVATDWPGYFPAAPEAVARLLVARGAAVDRLWQAAALGLLARLEELLVPRTTQEELDAAFWQACHGGQLRAAERLLAAGASLAASPDYANGQTGLEAALRPDTRREQLAARLRERARPGERPRA
jgi:uncharacterized protein